MAMKTKLYTFQNCEGKTIQVKGSATIEYLVRAGVTRIRLAKPGGPMEPNEWRCKDKPVARR